MAGLLTLNYAQPLVQGHSKKAAGDDGDRFGAILTEVLAGLGHGHTAGTNEVQHEIADCCEGAGSRADAASILMNVISRT